MAAFRATVLVARSTLGEMLDSHVLLFGRLHISSTYRARRAARARFLASPNPDPWTVCPLSYLRGDAGNTRLVSCRTNLQDSGSNVILRRWTKSTIQVAIAWEDYLTASMPVGRFDTRSVESTSLLLGMPMKCLLPLLCRGRIGLSL